MRTARTLSISLGLLLFSSGAFAVDGARDSSFQAPFGYRAFGTGTHTAQRGTVAPDGAAIYLGRQGNTTVYWGRIFESGNPNTCSFTPSGITLISPAQAAFDGSGRLLVAGSALYPGLGSVVFVARYLYPECALDTAFDGDGYFTFDLADELRGVAISPIVVLFAGSPVERLVVAGTVYAATGADHSDFLVLRLTNSGTLDFVFGGGDGWAQYDFDDKSNLLYDMEIDAQNRIVLGGTLDLFGQDADAMVARTLSNGTLDSEFGTSGWTQLAPEVDDRDEIGSALTLTPDSSTWIATTLLEEDSAPVRLSLRKLDSSGTAVYYLGWPASDDYFRVADLICQGDGRVIVFGDTDHQGGDHDLFVSACRPTASAACLWEMPFGPLDSDLLAYPLPDLTPDGDELAGGIALAAGRPILFAAAETASHRRALVARLVNSYIFADGFESGSTARW